MNEDQTAVWHAALAAELQALTREERSILALLDASWSYLSSERLMDTWYEFFSGDYPPFFEKFFPLLRDHWQKSILRALIRFHITGLPNKAIRTIITLRQSEGELGKLATEYITMISARCTLCQAVLQQAGRGKWCQSCGSFYE